MIDREGGQKGFSLIEAIIAIVVALFAMVGMLYLYKVQHKNMEIQGAISEMRMNGQYCLNEAQYYLEHAGLGLPRDYKNLSISGGELTVSKNGTKLSAPAAMDPSSGSSQIVYRIASADTGLFTKKAYAVAALAGGAKEAPILSVAPRPGVPSQALVTLLADKAGFPAATDLYPLEKIRLHIGTGIGGDTAAGDFKVSDENPGIRPGIVPEILTLAEGIEAITYRYFMLDGDSLTVLPGTLDSVQRIEVQVIAKTRLTDRAASGDGYHRQTLKAKIGYHHTL